jgi:hypothetical protein
MEKRRFVRKEEVSSNKTSLLTNLNVKPRKMNEKFRKMVEILKGENITLKNKLAKVKLLIKKIIMN